MPRHYVGADLSKAWIDVYHPQNQNHCRIANEPKAIRAFLSHMRDDEVLIFEATSRCDGDLISAIRSQDGALLATS